MCRIANAKITGNALLFYDLNKENGKWFGQSEQSINLNAYEKVGLGRSLGLNFGLVHYSDKSESLNGLSPTYAVNLNGKHYNLSSGYSIRVNRDIFNSWLYENMSVSLPKLPTFSVNYSRQGTRDIPIHNLNSNSDSLQFGIDDSIGPFRITLNRQERNLKDLIRGARYDVKTTDNYGNINFDYAFRRFLSLNGQYGMGQRNTEGKVAGNIKSKTQDLSMGFQLSPISSIALSVTTIKHSDQREDSVTKIPLPLNNNNLWTNTVQLRLEPLDGLLLNTIYSRNDISERNSFDENKSLELNVEPLRYFNFIGQFMAYDSQRQGKRILNLNSNSFELLTEIIEGLKFSSQLNISNSDDLISGSYSDRDNIIVGFEAMPTVNLRTDISYDWQRTNTRATGSSDEEIQHRVESTINYSFNDWLSLNFRYNRSIYSELGGSDSFLMCGLIYTTNQSHLSFLYNRSGSSNVISSQNQRDIIRSFTVLLDQEISQNTILSLDYESQINSREVNYASINRFTFRLNIRF